MRTEKIDLANPVRSLRKAVMLPESGARTEARASLRPWHGARRPAGGARGACPKARRPTCPPRGRPPCAASRWRGEGGARAGGVRFGSVEPVRTGSPDLDHAHIVHRLTLRSWVKGPPRPGGRRRG